MTTTSTRYDRSTFCGGDGRGYIDYPTHSDMAVGGGDHVKCVRKSQGETNDTHDVLLVRTAASRPTQDGK